MAKKSKKLVYMLDEASTLSSAQLGGKGAGLATMAELEIPVPPAFIILTDAGLSYFRSSKQVPNKLKLQVETALGKLSQSAQKTFGDHHNPLLVSVRSGAPISMPGQMSTIINVGMNNTVASEMGNNTVATTLHQRLYKSLAIAVGVEQEELEKLENTWLENYQLVTLEDATPKQTQGLISNISALIKKKTGKEVSEDPYHQLWTAIRAVWESWDTPTMRDYRRVLGVKNDMSTAVVVQQMILGNADSQSGTGVIYSRNPITGLDVYGSFLFRAQGEEVVSGERKTLELDALQSKFPKLHDELLGYTAKLESHYGYPVEVEFTIEKGQLWLLQVRRAVLSDRATIQYIVDQKTSGKINQEEAVELVNPSLIERLHLPVFSTQSKHEAQQQGRLITKGMPASPGVGRGLAVVSDKAITEAVQSKQPFILVRQTLDPREHSIYKNSQGIISASSSVGSHGALMANVLKKPCIVGCENLSNVDEDTGTFKLNGRVISEGITISVDGIYGEVFEGDIEVDSPEMFDALRTFAEWWNEYDGTRGNPNPLDGRPHSPWANATYSSNPTDIQIYRQKARELLTRNNWSTEKAQVIEIMHLIPEEARIKQVVIDANDKQLLKTLMYDVIKKGLWNGPRTALGPNSEGSSPWQMGIKTYEQVDAFLEDPSFQGVEKAPRAGYPRWMHPTENENWKDAPVQIIVMYDPPEKGMESVENEHFVCNVTCRSNPDEINIDINIGTAQTRSFEKISPSQLIRVTMSLNSNMPYLRGQRTLVFGDNYWDRANLDKIAKMLGMTNAKPDNLETSIREQMEQGIISEQILKRLVGSRTYKIARFVEEKVFDEWWQPPFKLPFIMRALDEVYSLQVLEIQGRADSAGKVEWFLIYDAKGREEKKTAAGH